jgi:hypothetical protein
MNVDVPQAAPPESSQAAPVRSQPSREAAFREQIAELKIPAPNAGRDKILARLGVLLAVVGIALGIVGYLLSHNTNNPLNQNDAQVLAILGLSCAVVGSAVFVRYSLANFLRLWLVRLIHEQRRD